MAPIETCVIKLLTRAYTGDGQNNLLGNCYYLLVHILLSPLLAVCHLIIGAGEEGSRQSTFEMPMILQEKQAFQSLIEQLTDYGDEISMADEMQGR